MGAGQVHYVNEVAYRRAVLRRVVAAIDLEGLGRVERGTGECGDQRRVFREGFLAEGRGGMRAGGIEITQGDDAPRGIGPGDVAQHLLDHEFRCAVRILGPKRMVFVQRQGLGFTVSAAEELKTRRRQFVSAMTWSSLVVRPMLWS